MKTGVFKSSPAIVHITNDDNTTLCKYKLKKDDMFWPCDEFVNLPAVTCGECKKAYAELQAPPPAKKTKAKKKSVVTKKARKPRVTKKRAINKWK